MGAVFEAFQQSLNRTVALKILPAGFALDSNRVERFRREARARGVPHLAHIEVGPVEPDEKHVDALQVMIRQGRWHVVCVAKSRGAVTLVGPYQRGKKEGPCATLPGAGEELDRAAGARR